MVSLIKNKKHSMEMIAIKRKFIDELGIKYTDTPQGWCSNEDDPRMKNWKKEREEWGFDSRETWNLDYSFYLWLYERLKVYNKYNIIDTTFHTFKYKDTILTLQECIDCMLANLEIYLTDQYQDSQEYDILEEIIGLFSLTIFYLWW